MALGRRELAKHEGPSFCGPCHAIREIYKFRSQWRMVDRAYSSGPYHWSGIEYPAGTLQATVVIGHYKTKRAALEAA